MRILKVLLILAFIQLTLGAANQRNVGKKLQLFKLRGYQIWFNFSVCKGFQN